MTEATIVPIEDDSKRKVALLKAIGLDRLAPEQRELAVNIATRYELDLLLKHLVMIEGRAYITRDGLLHIAHRSGQLDGIEVADAVLSDDGYWHATASVYRKDMSRPFTYAGRYPAKGKNQVFAPEMAVKVAEVMALRRAFDVAAPALEERWDREDVEPADEPPKPTSLAEKVQAKAAAVKAEPELMAEPMTEEASADEPAFCGAGSDPALGDVDICTLAPGHDGPHKAVTADGEIRATFPNR